MKSIREMSQPEIGALVVSHLKKMGIPVVLSGGAVVSIYSHARYVSKDLDLVNIYSHRVGEIKNAMASMGFREEGRYYRHPDSEFFIEFPPGPLSVGTEPIREIKNKRYETGVLSLISYLANRMRQRSPGCILPLGGFAKFGTGSFSLSQPEN